MNNHEKTQLENSMVPTASRRRSGVDFFGYPVFAKPLEELPAGRQVLVNTINQYSYCIAEADDAFRQALKQSDVLLPDGVAITLSARFLLGKKIRKIAGADLHQFLLEKMNREQGKVFYLGAAPATLEKIHERLGREFPAIRVGSFSPPYKPQFSAEESQAMIDAVNAFQPDVLFVGMTAPKQEKWAFQHKSRLDAGYICSIGAVFDFYAGTVSRPHRLWIALGLEWLGRLLKEPRRLWKRYIMYGPVFLYSILKKRMA